MYHLFYNFRERPFGLHSKLDYFYTSPELEKLCSDALRAMVDTDDVLVITGEQGAGKTALLKDLLGRLDASRVVVASVEPAASPKLVEFIVCILRSLNLPIDGMQPKEMVSALRNYLLAQSKRGKKVILAVDDAQNLSEGALEFIQLLVSLKVAERGDLQVVLTGTEEVTRTLALAEFSSLAQRVGLSVALPMMNQNSCRHYVEGRLSVAGWQGDPVIEEGVFGALCELANSRIAEIDNYADRLLMLGMLREKHLLSEKDVFDLTPEMMAKLSQYDAMPQEAAVYDERANESPQKQANGDTLPSGRARHSDRRDPLDDYLSHAGSMNRAVNSGHRKLGALALVGVVVSMSAFFYGQQVVSSSGKANVHVSVASDSGHNSGVTGHSSGNHTERYVLEEFNGQGSGDEHMLDITRLLERSVENVRAETDGASSLDGMQSADNNSVPAESNTLLTVDATFTGLN